MSGSTDCVVFDIKRYAIHDGPGIRTTVFFKGCPLSCSWCHNPEGITPAPQLVYDKKKCLTCMACVEVCPAQAISIDSGTPHHRAASTQMGPAILNTSPDICRQCGTCADICPSMAREVAGRRYSIKAILELIKKDLPFYENSGGGVTFSGGEPLMQWMPLVELLRSCRNLEIHTAVDTTGFAPWHLLEKVAPFADLFLFDIKHMDGAIHKLHTGVSNELILSNIKKLAMRGSSIQIRIPLIPEVNDDDHNIEATGQFIADLFRDRRGSTGIKGITLLPYHDFQKSKYIKFGIDYRAKKIVPPTEARIEQVQNRLQKFGLEVYVG